MRVLVVPASKHGATLEVAHAIAAELREAAIDADVWNARDVRSLDQVDGVVVGSGVYLGRWLPEAKQFIHEHRDELRSRPTWLFSVGPIGRPPVPAEPSVDVQRMAGFIGARGTEVFAGRLDKMRLSLLERAVVAALRVPQGDYRDWSAISAWGQSIADDLKRSVVNPWRLDRDRRARTGRGRRMCMVVKATRHDPVPCRMRKAVRPTDSGRRAVLHIPHATDAVEPTRQHGGSDVPPRPAEHRWVEALSSRRTSRGSGCRSGG